MLPDELFRYHVDSFGTPELFARLLLLCKAQEDVGPGPPQLMVSVALILFSARPVFNLDTPMRPPMPRRNR